MLQGMNTQMGHHINTRHQGTSSSVHNVRHTGSVLKELTEEQKCNCVGISSCLWEQYLHQGASFLITRSLAWTHNYKSQSKYQSMQLMNPSMYQKNSRLSHQLGN